METKKIDLKDVIFLLSRDPNIKEKVDDLAESVGKIGNGIDNVTSIHNVIQQLDTSQNILSTIPSLIFERVPIIKDVFNLVNSMRNGTFNIISIISGVLPSSIKSLFSEMQGSITSTFNVLPLVGKFLNPSSIVNNLLPESVSNTLKPVQNVLSSIGSSIPSGVSNLLNIGSRGGKTTSNIGKSRPPITGCFEFPDSVQLTEYHARPKRKK